MQPSSLLRSHRDCAVISQRIGRLEEVVFGQDESELVQKGSTKTNVHQDVEQQRTSEWLEDLLTDPQRRLPKATVVSHNSRRSH
jgi:hypothetical protein